MRFAKKGFALIMLSCICFCLALFAGCDQIATKTEHEHTLVSHEGQDPTCTKDGWRPYKTCSECNEYSTYSKIDALGHKYSLEYTKSGEVHTRSCTRCSSVLTEAHTWSEASYTEATCTTGGSQTYVCSDCGADKSVTTSMLGHDYIETQLPDGQQGFVCSRCSATVATHTHDWQIHAVITEPTCTENGETEMICSVCISKKLEITSALGHDFSDQYMPDGDIHSLFCTRCMTTSSGHPHTWQSVGVIKSPTCVETGEEKLACDVCGAEKNATLPLINHDFSEEYKPNGDVHSLFCNVCSATSMDHPHSWKSVEITTAPTCTDEGVEAFECIVCGAEKSEKIPMLSHEYDSEYKPDGDVHSLFCIYCSATTASATHSWQSTGITTSPTCTENGVEAFVCVVCDHEKTEVVDALGHDYSEKYKPNGDVHSRFCSRCDSFTDDNPHVWESLGVTKNPTCTQDGEESFICSVCSAEKTGVVPATHDSGEWITVTAATALEAGEKLLRCSSCKTELRTEPIPADVESMPILYFSGEYEKATASKNEVDMTVRYTNPNGEEFESYATIKVQGSSSAAYDKKNYTVKLYKDSEHEDKFKYNFGWGKESKYVIKANWVDFSQARNVVSCRLWGDIVKTRNTSENQQRLAALATNGGAIDGFPIAVFMNGTFHGLYTLNVPKDEWMFGMGEKDENGNKSTTEALIAADDWNHTDFYSLIGSFKEDDNGDIMAVNGGWELRYYGGDDYAWVAESFDALIKFCQDNDGNAFRTGIAQYLDVDAAIDYIVFMYANAMRDNASKNMLWATYDGKTWIPSAYDQDGTFGQVWDGVRFQGANLDLPSVKDGKIDVGINYGPSGNNVPKFILWDRIWNNFTEEVLDRYWELRESVLSTENMIAEFTAFEALIPESMFDADLERWQSSRDSWWAGKGRKDSYDYTAYHYDYIYQWIEDRMNNYDSVMRDISDYYGK